MANKKRGGPKRALKRKQRLPKAKEWIAEYEGKDIVKGYAKKFGVDKLCAVKELRMLGMEISEEKVQKVKAGMEQKRLENEKRKQKKQEQEQKDLSGLIEWNADFAYIAGYTSAGFPFGITHEEMKAMEPEWYERVFGSQE